MLSINQEEWFASSVSLILEDFSPGMQNCILPKTNTWICLWLVLILSSMKIESPFDGTCFTFSKHSGVAHLRRCQRKHRGNDMNPLPRHTNRLKRHLVDFNHPAAKDLDLFKVIFCFFTIVNQHETTNWNHIFRTFSKHRRVANPYKRRSCSPKDLQYQHADSGR